MHTPCVHTFHAQQELLTLTEERSVLFFSVTMANEVRGGGFCAFRKVLFWIGTRSKTNEVKQRETQIDYQKQAGSFWITKGSEEMGRVVCFKQF